MKKGIIFDKDGTLIQLDSVWYKIVHNVLDDLFKNYKNEKGKRDKYLQIIGMENDDFHSTSLLASQTNAIIATAWFSLIEGENIKKSDFINEIVTLFKKHSTSDNLVFKEIDGAKETLQIFEKA